MKIGNVYIIWKGHASFLIKTEKENIYIDPYKLSKHEEKADIILITHSHHDHCSIEDISKISKDGTVIFCTADSQSKIARIDKKIDLKIIAPGDQEKIKNINIGAIPAYNKDKDFHPLDEGWIGYIIKINNTTIYHSGDTDLIPEMEKLKGKITIALISIGGKYTMDAEQAAQAALIISPQLAIPMHYGEIIGDEKDAQKFKELCSQKGIRAEILKKE
jgi:L-ascorbate metabolism protein UlaG (beta-lactamase superfamily)